MSKYTVLDLRPRAHMRYEVTAVTFQSESLSEKGDDFGNRGLAHQISSGKYLHPDHGRTHMTMV